VDDRPQPVLEGPGPVPERGIFAVTTAERCYGLGPAESCHPATTRRARNPKILAA
jgi:hypothetical protein